MNGRERIFRTIAHEEPDRVPVGEWGIDHDHVSRILGRHTYWRNRKDITLALWENRRDEVVEGQIADYIALAEKLDYDILPVTLAPERKERTAPPPRQTSADTWEDEGGNLYKHCPANDSIQRVAGPVPEAREVVTDEDVAEMYARAEAVDTMDASRFQLIDAMVARFGKEKAIVCREATRCDNALLAPFGGDDAHKMMMTALAPEEMMKMQPAVMAYNTAIIRKMAEHGVDIMMCGKDYGSSHGCILSPQVILEFFMPIYRRAVADAAEAGMPTFFHCCGQIWEILEGFVEAGFSAYQSVQASAGMDWTRLKEEYGERLSLWAGVQCETLIRGTRAETEQEVRSALKTLMPGGGFIFGSTNSVQFGAKTENYLRALEIVREEGVY